MRHKSGEMNVSCGVDVVGDLESFVLLPGWRRAADVLLDGLYIQKVMKKWDVRTRALHVHDRPDGCLNTSASETIA